MPDTPSLDATARAALRAKAEKARQTIVEWQQPDDDDLGAAWDRWHTAQDEYRAAVTDPYVILALLAAVERGEADSKRLDHYRECAAKWCGYRLIPEDTTVRPDAASHVKPSEFDAMMDEYRAARAHPEEPANVK